MLYLYIGLALWVLFKLTGTDETRGWKNNIAGLVITAFVWPLVLIRIVMG